MNKLVLFGLFSLLMIQLFSVYKNYESLHPIKTSLIFEFKGNPESLLNNEEYSSMFVKALTKIPEFNSNIRLSTTFYNSQLNINVDTVSTIDPEQIKLISNGFVFDLNKRIQDNNKKGNFCANEKSQFHFKNFKNYKQGRIKIIDLWISICLMFSTWLWFKSISR
jgi:hypothetical protein